SCKELFETIFLQKNHVCSKSKHGLVASNFKYHLPVELLLRNSFFNSSTTTSISSLVCIPIFFNESLITSDRFPNSFSSTPFSAYSLIFKRNVSEIELPSAIRLVHISIIQIASISFK